MDKEGAMEEKKPSEMKIALELPAALKESAKCQCGKWEFGHFVMELA